MKKNVLYIKDWHAIHPYNNQQPSDSFFVQLANELYHLNGIHNITERTRKKMSLYAAAYLEDLISNVGLWKALVKKNQELYHTPIPFYEVDDTYMLGEVNEADLRFILWNTWQKEPHREGYIDPLNEELAETASAYCKLLDEAYETAPENDCLNQYFKSYQDEEEALHKLNWLFGRTYLTEPSVQIYDVKGEDIFTVPCGPLALFLYEWMQALHAGGEWNLIDSLFPVQLGEGAEMLQRNEENYRLFIEGNNGERIAYLQGYDALHRFLTQVLKWPDDKNHTLPQMKAFKDFILLINREKGMLLAHDICEYIHDPLNPFYRKEKAQQHAFDLLTQEGRCPADLLLYIMENNYLDDAQIPNVGKAELVNRNTDFIARHSLLYYYRGD